MEKTVWTEKKVMDLTYHQLIEIIEYVEQEEILYSRININQLRNRVIGYVNKGLI